MIDPSQVEYQAAPAVPPSQLHEEYITFTTDYTSDEDCESGLHLMPSKDTKWQSSLGEASVYIAWTIREFINILLTPLWIVLYVLGMVFGHKTATRARKYLKKQSKKLWKSLLRSSKAVLLLSSDEANKVE